MTALENVSLPMVLDGRLNSSQIKARATALLDKVGMKPRLDHRPAQLSGGEQQRVTIARSIANSPDLLLLDEPTGDLDSYNSSIVLQLLVDLNRKEGQSQRFVSLIHNSIWSAFAGMTCVMVTHDQMLKYFAHRVVHMVDGTVLRHSLLPIANRRRKLCPCNLK